jgi:Breast carcinoma amplified sequence 2 (BCAS2)
MYALARTTTPATATDGTRKENGDPPVVVLDSLPYVEAVHEDYEEYALALIEEEMKATEPRPLERRMHPLKFRTPMMRAEYGNNVKLVTPPPAGGDDGNPPPTDEQTLVAVIQRTECVSLQPAKIARPATIAEWRDHAIPEIKTRFEAERIRGLVLEVEREDGVGSWRDHVAALEDLKALWTRKWRQHADAVEEINFQRQQNQEQHFGPELERLNQQYQQALYARNQLKHGIEGLRRSLASEGENDRS